MDVPALHVEARARSLEPVEAGRVRTGPRTRAVDDPPMAEGVEMINGLVPSIVNNLGEYLVDKVVLT
jgi:hypothetical protein